jgi:hypothetical protein
MSGLLNSDKIVERSQITGERVIFPAANELQLDIDSEADLAVYWDLRMIFTEAHLWQEVSRVPSKTKGHYHVTLSLSESITPIERLLLQACLGSDRKRELLGYLNLKRGDSRPTLFIEPPVKQLNPYTDEQHRAFVSRLSVKLLAENQGVNVRVPEGE